MTAIRINPDVTKALVEERSPFSFRDHGLNACSLNDPAMASTAQAPESGKPIYTKVPVRRPTNFATVRMLTAQAASEQLANCFVGVFDSSGTRLGVSADQTTAFRAASGEKPIAITADSGKNLVVQGGPEVFVYIGLLVGTQGTTTLQFRTATATVGSPNFALAANGLSLRAGTKGTGLTALPTSFIPSELSAAAGPILMGA